MARTRLNDGLPTLVGVCLLFLGLLGFLWADGARRDAVQAKEQATGEVEDLRFQLRCQNGLQAEWAGALLAYIVALNSGDGAAVARVDAELATAHWQEAQQRCATR